MLGFVKQLSEALNAGDAEAFDALSPHIAENAKITLAIGNSDGDVRKFNVTSDTVEDVKGLLSGFVAIGDTRITTDRLSAAGTVHFYRVSDALFVNGTMERTPSGLIYGASVDCVFQMRLTRDQSLMLSQFICD